MQIKFLTIYDYRDTDPCQVQYELLKLWQDAIINDQVNFIYNAKVKFTEYLFDEYAEFDKERLIKELSSKTCYILNDQLNKHHNTFEALYNAFKRTHRVMELTITSEDE